MPTAPKARILLIDDSRPDLRVLTEIATAHGWAVSVAFNGKDGYHKALLSPFDLILLDVNMPELDGFGTCRLLKASPQTRHIPVIFLSAAGEQLQRLDGLLIGAVDYIVKSYANEEEIAARIAIGLQRASHPATQETDDPSLNNALPSAVLVRAAKKILLQHIAHPPTARAQALRKPDANMLGNLLTLVRLGEVSAIEEWCVSLELAQPELHAFAQQVQQAVRRLDFECLELLVQSE